MSSSDPKSKFLKTNIHFEQVRKDILKPENLLPEEFQNLKEVKDSIKNQGNDSINSISDFWVLQKLLPVASDITCINYMEIPSLMSTDHEEVIPYKEGQNKFVGCRGLWLGHRNGTISIYSPVTKKIMESVFDFRDKLNDVIHIDYYYTRTELNFCFVIAGCKNGDFGIMSFHENRSGTHIFSHKITSILFLRFTLTLKAQLSK